MHSLRSRFDGMMPAMRCASVAVLVASTGVIATACGGSGDAAKNADPASTAESKDCAPQPGKTADFVAVADYIKNTQPKPMRFLSAAGTDSAVSEDGMLAMQDKGPTYYYAGKESALKAVRDKLELAGPFTALLIVTHDATKNADGTRTIRLSGHFVTGEQDGKATKAQTYTMSCGPTGWTVASKKEEG
jgi:hypothetical protein